MTETATAQAGANVRAEMARRRISQQTLADTIGLSQAGLSKRLNGHVPWDVNELAAAAAALGVHLHALVGDRP